MNWNPFSAVISVICLVIVIAFAVYLVQHLL